MADTAAPPVVTPPWLDKGLYVAVLAPIVAVLNQKYGLTMDPVALIAVVMPAVAFIVMHKWKTGTIQAAMAAKTVVAIEPPVIIPNPAPTPKP